jgi:DNA-binding MarR family transcriptional regulator
MIESVVQRFGELMRALQAERTRRGVDPWFECSMSLPQLRALSLIAANERGLSSRDLAAALAVGASAITPLVDRLVERGYVWRREDPLDRRIARLQATAAGTELLDRLVAVKSDVLRDALAHLEPAELEAVGAALDVLRAGVRRASMSTTAQRERTTAYVTPQETTA